MLMAMLMESLKENEWGWAQTKRKFERDNRPSQSRWKKRWIDEAAETTSNLRKIRAQQRQLSRFK
jgi:hypothetical protein